MTRKRRKPKLMPKLGYGYLEWSLTFRRRIYLNTECAHLTPSEADRLGRKLIEMSKYLREKKK